MRRRGKGNSEKKKKNYREQQDEANPSTKGTASNEMGPDLDPPKPLWASVGVSHSRLSTHNHQRTPGSLNLCYPRLNPSRTRRNDARLLCSMNSYLALPK